MAGDDEIQSPENWGEIPSHYGDMINNVKKVFLSNPFPKEEQPALKEEVKECSGSLNAIGPVVPGSMFIVPTT